jgi:hypothetical protein
MDKSQIINVNRASFTLICVYWLGFFLRKFRVKLALNVLAVSGSRQKKAREHEEKKIIDPDPTGSKLFCQIRL